MSIRVKVDEDLPRQVAELFSAYGHDAVTVVMQGWQGLTDEALWPRVQQEERWLVTADKGFADLRVYSPGSHAGVLLRKWKIFIISGRRHRRRDDSFSGWMKKVDAATWS